MPSKNQKRLQAELDGNSWTINELRMWLDELVEYGCPGTQVIRARTSGNRDLVGLLCLVPWNARGAGSADPAQEGGGPDGETPGD